MKCLAVRAQHERAGQVIVKKDTGPGKGERQTPKSDNHKRKRIQAENW